MKRVLCYGDSNTYGFDGRKMAETGEFTRFDESTRWTCLLQELLGPDYRVTAEGMGGRTTVFDDPLEYGRCGIMMLDTAFKSHEPVDLVMIMLGTNDLKDQFSASAEVITSGMERIVIRLKELISESRNPKAQILIVSPLNVSKTSQGVYMYDFSDKSVEKGAALAGCYQKLAQKHGCQFANADEWAKVDPSDGTHMNPEGHRSFAENLAPVIRSIIG